MPTPYELYQYLICPRLGIAMAKGLDHEPIVLPAMPKAYIAYWKPWASTILLDEYKEKYPEAAIDIDFNVKASYQDVEARIPILVTVDGKRHAFFPAISCSPRSSLELYAIQKAVMEKNGIGIDHVEVVHVNPDYVQTEETDLGALLIHSDALYKKQSKKLNVTIDEMIEQSPVDLDGLLSDFRRDLEGLPEAKLISHCTAPRKCCFYEGCFSEDDLSEDSIYVLQNMTHKKDLAAKGIENMKQIPVAWMEGTPFQYAQVQSARTGKEFVDVKGLQRWLKSIEFPLIYLDFEWDTWLIPPYEGMKPFDVLCFQYSMHTLEKDRHLQHKSFFGAGDCRKAFIEALLEDLPETGTILVYNMEGAEKLRLKQLAAQFPEYADRLEAVWNRMADLALPFEHGLYYHPGQKGHFSLKTMLPLLTDSYAYQALAVHDGVQAVQAYRKILKSKDEHEKNQLVQAIGDYCAMDTMAEVMLYEALKKKSREQ